MTKDTMLNENVGHMWTNKVNIWKILFNLQQLGKVSLNNLNQK